MSAIFLLVRDSFANILYHQTSLQWLPITQVCHQWRLIAVHEARLWTVCALGGSPEWHQLVLERSKQSLLSVIIQGGLMRVQNKESIFNILEQAYRFRTLHIQTEGQTDPIMSTYNKDFAVALEKLAFTHAPHLERLALNGYPPRFSPNMRPHPSPPDFLSGGTPQLRHLDLLGWKVPWTSHIFSGLTTLKVFITSPYHLETDSLSDFLDALERMPELKELSLHTRTSISDAGDRVVKLPSLQKLNLKLCMYDCTDFMEHVTFRVSAKVTLDIDFWHAEEGEYDVLITRLVAGLQSAWLSNRCPPLVADQEFYKAISAIKVTEGQEDVEFNEENNHGRNSRFKLCVKGWFNQAANFVHGDSLPQARDPAVHSLPSLSLSINDPSSSIVYSFLSVFPRNNLTSLYMDAKAESEVWEMISRWPSIKALGINQKSAPEPTLILSPDSLFDSEMNRFANSLQLRSEELYAMPPPLNTNTNTAEASAAPSNTDLLGPQKNNFGKSAYFSKDLHAVTSLRVPSALALFRSLEFFSFTQVDFGSSDNGVHVGAIDFQDFCDLLTDRYVRGIPLRQIGFTRCLNLHEADVERVRRIVPDVHWDGVVIIKELGQEESEEEMWLC